MKPTYEELELQLEESQREFRAADVTIHNLELKITDMAVQLANAESKCRELLDENLQLQRDKDSLEAAALAMRDDMREAREKLESAEKRIAELGVRKVTVKLPADYRNDDGSINDDMFNTCEVVGAFRDALASAGIGVKGE